MISILFDSAYGTSY